MYYVVKARTVFHNQNTNEIEFRATIKKFEDQNPIDARKAAFNFKNQFIRGILTEGLHLTEEEIGWNPNTKQIEKLTDREIRKLLNPFLDYEDSEKETILNSEDVQEVIIDWQSPDDTIAWYSQFNNGIWIILVHNDTDPDLVIEDDIVIDKITKYEEPLPTPPLYTNLEIEYKLYKKYEFDTEDYVTVVHFFDDEEFLEGYSEKENETEEEAQSRHLEGSYKVFKCLKTSFDWSGYEKINWWENSTSNIKYKEPDELPITVNEAFNNGESHLVEFKPGLLNWENSDRDIELEIAQTLCAFLNSKGGYLFIGIADKDKKVYGVKFPDNSKDKFLREFTRIKARHLPPYLAHNINGEFYMIENKTVFVITVYPCIDPVFLRKKDEQNNKTLKEFYIRSDASSRHLYDIEEILRYCRLRDQNNLNRD